MIASTLWRMHFDVRATEGSVNLIFRSGSALCWVFVMAFVCCAAQEPVGPPPASASSVEVNVNRVFVSVVVRNRQGQTVDDLKKEDFTVLDDDKPRAISGFVVEQRRTEPPMRVAAGAAAASGAKSALSSHDTGALGDQRSRLPEYRGTHA
jgi:hypothetical protein